jgi:hypothetical protein
MSDTRHLHKVARACGAGVGGARAVSAREPRSVLRLLAAVAEQGLLRRSRRSDCTHLLTEMSADARAQNDAAVQSCGALLLGPQFFIPFMSPTASSCSGLYWPFATSRKQSSSSTATFARRDRGAVDLAAQWPLAHKTLSLDTTGCNPLRREGRRATAFAHHSHTHNSTTWWRVGGNCR